MPSMDTTPAADFRARASCRSGEVEHVPGYDLLGRGRHGTLTTALRHEAAGSWPLPDERGQCEARRTAALALGGLKDGWRLRRRPRQRRPRGEEPTAADRAPRPGVDQTEAERAHRQRRRLQPGGWVGPHPSRVTACHSPDTPHGAARSAAQRPPPAAGYTAGLPTVGGSL